MNIGILSFTTRGFELGERITLLLRDAGHTAEVSRCGNNALAAWTRDHFAADHALLFIGAAGIAVRAVAPLIKSKTSDPAVITIDEHGRFVIPLLSGHIGGANELAKEIAMMLGALPIITTATDSSGIFAVDSWATKNNLCILNPERIKWVSARLLAGENIKFRSLFPIIGPLPNGFEENSKFYDLSITIKTKGKPEALKLVPPVLTLGVGCRKGVSCAALERAFGLILSKASFLKEAVAGVCSIDLKLAEPGLLEFCQAHSLPFQTYSAAQLNAVKGHFTSSEFVRKTTGTDNVCERSAVLGSGGTLLTKKDAGNGITMAFAIAPYTVRFMED